MHKTTTTNIVTMWPSILSLVLLAFPLIHATPSVVRHMEKRQSTFPVPKMNITAWDDQVTTACLTKLEELNGTASNIAGLAMCYNLPFLDSSSGHFLADLRLFQISPATGAFSGVPSQDVAVSLQYFGAQVQLVNSSAVAAGNAPAKRSVFKKSYGLSLGGLKALTWPVTRDVKADDTNLEALAALHKRQAGAPVLVQAYLFAGQVNQTMLAKVTTTASLEGLVIPITTLSAFNSTTKATVNSTLSSDEATFVSGFFSNSLTPNQLASVAAAASASALAIQSTLPFKLPGARILIFPVGGVVTGIWAMLFLVTVAYGTVGRYRFQQQFRTRSARADFGGGKMAGQKYYGGL